MAVVKTLAIGIGDHHTGQHASHRVRAREHVGGFIQQAGLHLDDVVTVTFGTQAGSKTTANFSIAKVFLVGAHKGVVFQITTCHRTNAGVRVKVLSHTIFYGKQAGWVIPFMQCQLVVYPFHMALLTLGR